MAGSTISGTITQAVTLGGPGYASPLTVTNTGAVIPANGSIAIYDTVSGGIISNQGAIIGAEFGIVDYGANSSITNTGTIIGNGTGTTAGDGIFLLGSGNIINGTTTATHALISGAAEGLALIASGGLIGVTNDATITGSLAGIALTAGTITNGTASDNTALITGVFLGTGLVSNFATITSAGPGTISALSIYGNATATNGAANDTTALIENVNGIAAVNINGNGTLFNDGIILGGITAISLTGSGSITNSGEIIGGPDKQNSSGLTYGSDGIYVRSTAAVTIVNNLTGTITAGIIGIDLAAAVSVTNAGLISNAGTIIAGYTGLYENGLGGTILNAGIITGGYIGIVHYGAAVSIQNTGIIAGIGHGTFQGVGIIIDGSAVITNGAAGNHHAVIDGGSIAIGIVPATNGSLASYGTITNYGTIASAAGSGGVAIAFAGNNNLLIDEPGSVFTGTVAGGANLSTIELGAGSTGAITGIGSQFIQFSNINFATGATWRAEGNLAGLATGQTIAGFTASDTIILDGITETSFTYVRNTGLEINGSTTLDLVGSFSTASFKVENVAAGAEIMLCYRRGTRIATPAGDIPIEHLNIGDAVITRFHGYRKIKWIGRQSFNARLIRKNPDQFPVEITQGAVGSGLPKRDLFISPGHSMLINNILILAKNLINGVTITQTAPNTDLHYYQLEFETHDCILAEGAWSESFADGPGMRAQFHNADKYYESFPDYIEPAIFNMCAERPEAGLDLEAALTSITACAAKNIKPGALRGWIDHADGPNIEGWALDLANPRLPVGLEILLGDTPIGRALACHHRPDLAAAKIAAGSCHFTFSLPRLTRAQRRQLRVRRLQDAAELTMTKSCQKPLELVWRVSAA